MKTNQDNPFKTRLSREKFTENLVFGLLRGVTFFVLFCAAYLFWDIFSKGAGKVFEGEGILNWEFLTDDPQTLHVLNEDGVEQRLSSKKYYALKDKKTLNRWNEFLAGSTYDSSQQKLNEAFSALEKEWQAQEREKILQSFVAAEKDRLVNKFGFWKDLLSDTKATAVDFEVPEADVPAMVSGYFLGHLNQESNRLALVKSEITRFRATHYPTIEKLNVGNLQSLEEAYRTFLNHIAEPYGSSLSSFSDEITKTYQKFLDANGPKEFGHFKEALIAYGQVREVVIAGSAESSVWQSIQSALRPFEEAVSVSLPSIDYAYSGGGIFPAIIGTLLLVVGAMLIAIVLGVFCAIFLAEYGKSGRFLSLVRLAILNLAGVPSIIFGLFGFGLFVIFLDWNVSLLAGWFTLAFMVLPVVITASEEALRSIPQGFRESSLALGATKWTMIKTSVLPYAMPGILTSSILGVARAAGETAPIMFTAAYAKRSELPWEGLENWTDFFFQGVMALPYHIYVVSAKIPQNAYTADMQYGTAFVFLVLVLGVASLSILLRNRLRKKYRW